MQINCISCGHKVDVGKSYDDFDGQVKCNVCGTILQIKTEEGQVKSVHLALLPPIRQ